MDEKTARDMHPELFRAAAALAGHEVSLEDIKAAIEHDEIDLAIGSSVYWVLYAGSKAVAIECGCTDDIEPITDRLMIETILKESTRARLKQITDRSRFEACVRV